MKLEHITKNDFLEYENVRKSGVTNMVALKTVTELTGLGKEKIIAIMRNYTTLAKKYLSSKRTEEHTYWI